MQAIWASTSPVILILTWTFSTGFGVKCSQRVDFATSFLQKLKSGSGRKSGGHNSVSVFNGISMFAFIAK